MDELCKYTFEDFLIHKENFRESVKILNNVERQRNEPIIIYKIFHMALYSYGLMKTYYFHNNEITKVRKRELYIFDKNDSIQCLTNISKS